MVITHLIINTFVTDLPKDTQLDDLASLINVDNKNFDPEQLGSDIIKEQQVINLKFSSGQCTVIPEDRAQVMLTSVSSFSTLKRGLLCLITYHAFGCGDSKDVRFFQALHMLQMSGALEIQAAKL